MKYLPIILICAVLLPFALFYEWRDRRATQRWLLDAAHTDALREDQDRTDALMQSRIQAWADQSQRWREDRLMKDLLGVNPDPVVQARIVPHHGESRLFWHLEGNDPVTVARQIAESPLFWTAELESDGA